MLIGANKQTLSALAALEGNPNFETVMKWLRDSREDLNKSYPQTRDEILVRQMQGACQTLDTFIGTATSSRETIAKSR